MPVFELTSPRGKKITIEAVDQDTALRGAQQWDLEDHASSEATRLGVSPDLILRQMNRESRVRPDAVSPKGARGPMQLMPGTAKDLGVDPDDPYQNITGGITYMKRQLDTHGGDERLALAAYNAGPDAVRRYGGVPPYAETQKYVGALAGRGAPGLPPPPAPRSPAPKPAQAAQKVSQRLGFIEQFAKPYANVSRWIEGAMDKAGYEPADWINTVSRNLQAAEADARAKHPEVYKAKPGKVGGFAGSVLGTSPLMWLPGGPAVQGAAIGAVESDKRNVSGVLTDAAIGGVTGKLTDLALGKVASVVSKKVKVATPEELTAVKDAAYAAVDNSGVKFKAAPIKGLATATAQDLKAARYNPLLHPKVTGVMQELEALKGSTPTLTELDQFRQFVRTEVMSGTPGEQRLGKIILGNIDSFIETAKPSHVLAGDPQAAARAIQIARDLNTRVAKTTAVNEALDNAGMTAKAAGSGANIDNRTRQELIKVLKKTYNFTPDEEAAISKAIEGGGFQNLLRGLGKVSPLNGGIPGLINTLAVLPTGGASLGLAIPTSGAKLTADAMTRANVAKLLQTIAVGGSKQALAKTPTLASRAVRAVTPAVTLAAVAGASQARAKPRSK